MPGIGQQRDRVRDHAVDPLDGDEAEIEDDADDEGTAEIGRRRVAVAVAEQAVTVIVVRVTIPLGRVRVVVGRITARMSVGRTVLIADMIVAAHAASAASGMA